MPLTTTDGLDWPDIPPQGRERGRGGWRSKRFRRFGMARIATADGGFERYGIYGIRGEKIFTQYEGWERDGCLGGISGEHADADLEQYLWWAAGRFTDTRVFADMFMDAARAAKEAGRA